MISFTVMRKRYQGSTGAFTVSPGDRFFDALRLVLGGVGVAHGSSITSGGVGLVVAASDRLPGWGWHSLLLWGPPLGH